MSISEKLDVNRVYKQPFGLKSEKTTHRVTFFPSSANPGETLKVHIPKLAENVVIVPNSVGLLFTLEVHKEQANNTVVNNIGRNLVSNMKVTFGGNLLGDTHKYDMISTYQDLFLTKEERENRILEGISEASFRKHRTASGNKGTDAKEVKLAGIYGKKFRIPINHPILDNHGVFYPRAFSQTLIFEMTLAKSADIGITSDSSKKYTYTLSNIELEYQCIMSEKLAVAAQTAYQVGKGFYYENVLHEQEFSISKPNDSLINLTVTRSLRSLRGVLFLFNEAFTAGARDSEKFVNPDITEVSVSINGVPNQLFSNGMLPSDFWGAIVKRYGLSDNVTQKDFYNDKFALWIDLRTSTDGEIHGDGLLLNSTKDGVKIQMKRTAGDSGNISGHMFVIGDAVMKVQNCDFDSIIY